MAKFLLSTEIIFKEDSRMKVETAEMWDYTQQSGLLHHNEEEELEEEGKSRPTFQRRVLLSHRDQSLVIKITLINITDRGFGN